MPGLHHHLILANREGVEFITEERIGEQHLRCRCRLEVLVGVGLYEMHMLFNEGFDLTNLTRCHQLFLRRSLDSSLLLRRSLVAVFPAVFQKLLFRKSLARRSPGGLLFRNPLLQLLPEDPVPACKAKDIFVDLVVLRNDFRCIDPRGQWIRNAPPDLHGCLSADQLITDVFQIAADRMGEREEHDLIFLCLRMSPQNASAAIADFAVQKCKELFEAVADSFEKFAFYHHG